MDGVLLQVRELLDRSSDGKSKNHTCPAVSLTESAEKPFIGKMSFHTFNMILSGSCAAFACVVIFVVMFVHATHLSKPNEQIKIMRISLLIPFYSVLSFLSICFPAAQVYIFPWTDFVQGIALGTFFLLLCEFVSPSPAHRDVFMAALAIHDKKSPSGQTDGLRWYRRMWFMIFQYPVVALVVTILTAITEAAGVYCQFETKPYWAKIWLTIIRAASLVIAVTSVWRFYRQLKSELANHKPLPKFLAFKLVVFLTFLQSILFMILRGTGALKPTPTMTFADIEIGVPAMLLCLEMVPFSLFFVYAYSWRPYIIGSRHQLHAVAEQSQPHGEYQPQSYAGGPLGLSALLEMWNPMEIVEAVCFGFQMKIRRQRLDGRRGGAYDSADEVFLDQYK